MTSDSVRFRWLWPTCVVVLLASNLLLLWKLRELRGQIRYGSQDGVGAQKVGALLGQHLQDVSGGSVTLSGAQTHYLLLFIFTPSDCQFCDAELENFNNILQKRPDVAVFGLMSYSNADEARETSKYYGLTFPVLLDRQGRTLQSLSLRQTPWKIVVDVPQRRIVFEDPPSETQAQRDSFLARMYALPQS